jgi:hypothetical protein
MDGDIIEGSIKRDRVVDEPGKYTGKEASSSCDLVEYNSKLPVQYSTVLTND